MKRYNILIMLSLILGMTACSDSFLDPALTTSKELNKGLKTANDLHNFTCGIYNTMNASTYYGSAMIVYGEVRSDNVYNNERTGRYVDISNFSMMDTDPDASKIWQMLYGDIGQANILINNTSVVQDDEVKFYKAQGYALRGLHYFDLNRLFSQKHCKNNDGLSVPIVTEYDETAAKQGGPRNTIEEVEYQIEQDYLKALQLMDESGFEYEEVKNEITPDAVKALLARHYLYTENYKECIKYCSEIIESGKYSFSLPETYKGMWREQGCKESIFELSYTSSDHNGTESYPYLFEKDGYGDFQYTSKLLNLFKDQEVRYPYLAEYDSNGYLDRSTAASERKLTKMPELNQANIPVRIIAYPEVVLNYVEACVMSDNRKAQALILMNELLEARGAELIESVNDLTADRVLIERRKELVGEGHRFFDLMRHGKSFVTLKKDGTADLSLEYPNNKFAFPIPKSELQAFNTGIKTQNPGY